MSEDTEKEKIVYFVRHGQSEANITPVFQGPDSPLTEEGKQQAGKLAERAANLSFDALIASPFQRARETAETIGKATGKKPEFSDLFVERIKPARMNGKSYDDEEIDVLWREWEESLRTPGMRVEDGENFDDLVARVDKALAYLKGRPEQSLVVVTHGFFLFMVLARVLFGDMLTGEIFRKFQSGLSMKNTGITVLRYKGAFEEEPSWRLWIYNDHAHLG